MPAFTDDPVVVTTQPTRGFGVVVKRPFSAISSARRIMAWSIGENALISGYFLLRRPLFTSCTASRKSSGDSKLR